MGKKPHPLEAAFDGAAETIAIPWPPQPPVPAPETGERMPPLRLLTHDYGR